MASSSACVNDKPATPAASRSISFVRCAGFFSWTCAHKTPGSSVDAGPKASKARQEFTPVRDAHENLLKNTRVPKRWEFRAVFREGLRCQPSHHQKLEQLSG